MSNWRTAAADIVDSYSRISQRLADYPDGMDFCANSLARAVRDRAELPSWAFVTLGVEACHHLRSIGAWNQDEFIDLLCSKQADYGHDNINAFGLTGVAVRINDKMARLHNLTNKAGDPRNETLVDTWHDIVGYSVIAQMIYNNTFDLPLREDYHND